MKIHNPILSCLHDINQILPESGFISHHLESLPAAHLLCIAMRFDDPSSVSLETVVNISKEENVNIDIFLSCITDETWENLKPLCMKYDAETFAMVAQFGYRSDLLPLLSPRSGISFTPESIEQLAIRLLDIQPDDKVAALCCGVGNFAFSIGRTYPECEIHTYETNPLAATITQIRTAYSTGNISIHNVSILSDALKSSYGRFDKIFAHYPFETKHHITPDSSLPAQFLHRDIHTAWTFNYEIKKLLSDQGKAAVIMTRGSAQNNLCSQIRKTWIESGDIECVVSLPERMFRISNIPTLLVILSKNNKTVRMVDASDLCERGRRFTIISQENIEMIHTLMTIDSEISKSVSLEELSENDYVLIPDRYLSPKLEHEDDVRFGDLMIDISRGAHCTAEQIDTMASPVRTNIRYLKSGDIQDGMIADDTQYLSKIEKNFEKYCIADRNLVINKNSSPVKIAVASVPPGKKILASANLYIIHLNENMVDPYYVQAYLCSEQGQLQLKRITTGTRVPSIGAKDLKELRIPLPALEKQKIVAERFRRQLHQIARAKKRLLIEKEKLNQIFQLEME